MSQAVDYYKVLQVRFGAGKADIASAYRRLCKLYHPDINRDPAAAEYMKQINMAYHTLHDDMRRAAYNTTYAAVRPPVKTGAAQHAGTGTQTGGPAAAGPDDAQATLVMRAYFSALMDGSYEKAYGLLCRHDRQYVTLSSFTKWRRSVGRVYAIRDFSVKSGAAMSAFTLENGETVRARQFHIEVTEKNIVTAQINKNTVTKLAILDQGIWRAFLGYRDLNEIARVFEQLFAEQQQGEMLRHWEAYLTETCRELDMLSLDGLLKQAGRELYRFKRYNQPLTIACYSVAPSARKLATEARGALLERTADALSSALRETDIPAYIGDGVFAVLFTGLKKRQAADITSRLADKLRQDVRVQVEYAHESYAGGALKPILDGLMLKLPK